MNCECVYYNKNATKADYIKLAERIAKQGETCEVFPVTISKITRKTKCYDDINGNYGFYARTSYIPEGATVLFVGGKLWYMTKTKRVDGITYKGLFPSYEYYGDEPFFEDVETFD